MSALSYQASYKKRHFLVIEDDQDIARLLSLSLSDLNGQVTSADNGLRGLALARNQSWDLIVLDIQLPDFSGLEICRQLRNEKQRTPIIMLTARSTELDRVLGLEIGADDYLTKPFSMSELQARIKALLRRTEQTTKPDSSHAQNTHICIDQLSLDKDQHLATLQGQPIDLTPCEFKLLYLMADNPDRVYSRIELLHRVWGYQHQGYEHTVNSHMNRLRKKLGKFANYIDTVWGVGYRFHVNKTSHPNASSAEKSQ